MKGWAKGADVLDIAYRIGVGLWLLGAALWLLGWLGMAPYALGWLGSALSVVGVMLSLSMRLLARWARPAPPPERQTARYTISTDRSQVDHLKQAAALMEKNRYGKAEAIYRSVIERAPDDPAAYIGLGSCRLEGQDLDGAEENYRKALQLRDGLAPALVGLGTVAMQREEYAVAEGYYRRALSIEPGDLTTRAVLAELCERTARVAEAIAHWNQIARLAPQPDEVGEARARVARLTTRLAGERGGA